VVVLLLAGCSAAREGSEQSGAPPGEVRIGYMPNLTHAQAVLGVAEGTFARHLGVPVRPRLFTSGSAALQALFAGEVDLLYIGPAPAL